VLAGVGLAGGVLALQWGLGALARSDGPRLWLALIAVAGGFLLAGIGFHHLAPPGTLSLRRGLPTVITLRGLYSGAFLGVEAFIPLMLVTERGMSAVEAGLVLTGGALGWTVGSFVQARPGLRLPRHLLLVSGAVILGLSESLLVLAVRPPMPGWTALGFWALAAVGMGLGMSSTSVLVLRYSETGAEGRNSSALQVSDSLGGALGIGLSGAVFATWHQPNGSDAALFTWMWLAFGAVALTASLIAFRARPPVVPA
jgi:MFS family permease